MPRLHMTDMKIKNLKPPPPPKQIDYFDDPAKGGLTGLVLRHSYGGALTWRVMYYEEGKSRTFKLGRYPVLKLSEARIAARKFLQNPEQAIADKEPKVKPPTFEQVASDYLRIHVGAEKKRTARVIKQRIDKHLMPDFRDMDFSSIGKGALMRLLDRVMIEHGPTMADAILGLFRAIANWHEPRSDEEYQSPYSKTMKRIKKRTSRKRVLDDEELRALWSATAELGTFGALLRVLLLTGQRRAKVNFMKWDDIRGGVWHIKTEENEKPNPGRIKLPRAVLEIIETQPKFENNPFVFAATRGRGPFNSFGQHVLLLDKLMRRSIPDMEPHTIHDLRRTMRTRLSRIEIAPHIAERCIGHVVGTDVERTYDQHDFYQQTTAAFEALAKHILEIVTRPPANVVRLARSQR